MVKARVRRAVLVYQAGLANVFEVERFTRSPEGRNAIRHYQGDFRGAEMFARGLEAAGATVWVVACNRAGDVAGAVWDTPLRDAPFRESFGFEWFIRRGIEPGLRETSVFEGLSSP